LLGKLPEPGKRAVVMVTHDPSGAAYCTRLLNISDGLLESDEAVVRP
jgi:putative ABC transport system ATP-binding protein